MDTPTALRQQKQSELGEKLLHDLLEALENDNVWREYIATCGGDSVVKMQEIKLLSEKMLVMAGSVCKDWSSMNQGRKELLGSYVLPFAISLALVRFIQPMAFLHECTRMFKPGLFEDTFVNDKPDKFGLGYTLTSWLLDPQDFGFPVRRSRVYTCLMRKDYDMTIQKKEIRNLFNPTQLNSAVFFQATDSEAESRVYISLVYQFQVFLVVLSVVLSN